MNPEWLLAWYQRFGRSLPWRETREPYRIWVSELMLQQTRVDTVIPYYAKWLSLFPDVQSLARASLDEVLLLWQGLGYYRRARFLHQGARLIVEQMGGHFPTDSAALTQLPGIGDSTAASILSICYDQRLPVFDGNVQRVVARVTGCLDSVDLPPVRRHLLSLAAQWIEQSPTPGDHNQAMMDLGATLCTPLAPQCRDCPLREGCEACRQGIQVRIPVKKAKAPVPEKEMAVVVLVRGGRLFLQQRLPDGLLGGLWELPGCELKPGETPVTAVERELAEEHGVEATAQPEFAKVKHAYSHFTVVMHAHRCDLNEGEPVAAGGMASVWVTPSELDGYALPKATIKVLDALGEPWRRAPSHSPKRAVPPVGSTGRLL